MRRLLVDLYTYQGSPGWLKKDDEHLPNDFLRSLAVRLLEKRKCRVDPTKSGDFLTSYMERKMNPVFE
jgi:hypothetical protein